MKVTTLNNLKEFLELMKAIFGKKSLAVKHRDALDTYIINIDYENNLSFNTEQIIFDNSPYVGNAVVGSTRVA